MNIENLPNGEARALLWRHGLPEDVIDGVLALHAQELAVLSALHATGDAADIGTEFVGQVDRPDEAGLAAFEAALAEQTGPKADSKPAPDVCARGHSEEPCPGFPDRCPNLRNVEPEPGRHWGGVRCGCADDKPALDRLAEENAQLRADLDRLEEETIGDLNEKNITLARQLGALKTAHTALAAQAGRDQAAIDRVRALHYKDGAHCAVCTEDFGRLNADWPCPTIRALDEPAPLPEFIEVAQYRHDHGHQAWAWRCWGHGDCDGWLALDKSSQEAARRGAERHLADDHKPAKERQP
jgi:hypothetical protein